MFEPPRSMSPSGIGTFTTCALQYKYGYIDRLATEQTLDQVRGIIVHDALFRLFWQPLDRNLDSAYRCMSVAVTAAADAIAEVGSTPNGMHVECEPLVERLFELEAPNRITPIGLELKVEGTFDGEHTVRGIIDRLELLDDGTYCITDYKTGKAPSKAHLHNRTQALLTYAALTEVQLGIPVGTVQLLCLGGKKPKRIRIHPTPTQLEAARRRTLAVWQAVEIGCKTETFLPNPNVLCGWCDFRELCPAGDAYLRARGK